MNPQRLADVECRRQNAETVMRTRTSNVVDVLKAVESSANDVPALVAEVRRLRAQVRALEEHVARLMATDMDDPEGRGGR
jgi:hypothetical protein